MGVYIWLQDSLWCWFIFSYCVYGLVWCGFLVGYDGIYMIVYNVFCVFCVQFIVSLSGVFGDYI